MKMKLLLKYFYLVTGPVVFVIYIFTLAPSVVQIDAGELATVQVTLGIAHPTGYPLFTIIGYLFSLIPFPFAKIFQMNLLAAIYCSASISVFVYTIKFVLDNLQSFSTSPIKEKKETRDKRKGKKNKNQQGDTSSVLSDTIKYFLSITGGLILALSETFWMQSTSVEVYSLHLLLINIIILSLLKAFINNTNDISNSRARPWLIFAIFLALGFTNHMTTLLIIPGVAYLYFAKNKFLKEILMKIFWMLVVFFAVLIIVYLYLPIRASQEPLLNWGNPIDFERFFRHFTGKQYQVWLFASTEAAKKQLIYFFETLPGEFSFSIILPIIGLFVSYRYAKKLFVFLLVTFLFSIFYSINYDIHDIDSYFLLAYISLAFFSVFGLLKLFELAKYKIHVVTAIAILFVGVQFYSNFNKVNQSGIYTYEDYTKAILNSVSKQSIIFSYQWDYFISASYYFRYVEGFRKDVAIVDKELLRRSWYFDQLSNNYPYILKNIKDDVNKFKKALVPFERNETFNPNLLESLYRKVMTGLVATNIDSRNFYIAPELFENEIQRGLFSLPPGYTLVPDVLLFKVVKGNEYVPAADPDFIIRINGKRNEYINNIEKFVGSMLARRARYEMQFGKVERAKVYIRKIKNDLPGYKLLEIFENILKSN